MPADRGYDARNRRDQGVELRGPYHRHRQLAALQHQLAGVLRAVVPQGDPIAARDRDVDEMRRCGPTGQDLDHASGTVQVDSAMPQPVGGRMNDAVDGVEGRLEPFPGSKINTGTPARRGHRSAASLKPPYDLGAQRASASGHHDPHLVRILVGGCLLPCIGHLDKEVTMAVASRGAALNAFQELISHDPVEAGTILRRPYLPTGLESSDDPVGMGPSTLIGGYGEEARYTLGAPDPATMLAIAGAPSDVLSGRPSITTSETVTAYAKASLDLTMEGGTTSGVVYPLAVCELATSFRFRNVGGASAGAIAAALTAAAEFGRSSRVLVGRLMAQPGEQRRHTSAAPKATRYALASPASPTSSAGSPRLAPATQEVMSTGSPSSSDPAGPPPPSSGLESRSCAARAGHCPCSPCLPLDGSLACSPSR